MWGEAFVEDAEVVNRKGRAGYRVTVLIIVGIGPVLVTSVKVLTRQSIPVVPAIHVTLSWAASD
tara:strand:+ start:131 stop:322 length:192 start_codon:yes stop_codon:yes gene_type:complete